MMGDPSESSGVLQRLALPAAHFDIENPQIRRLLTGPGHTQVGRLEQTLEALIPAKGMLPFSKFNVGAMGPGPVTGFNCTISAAAAPTS